MGEGEYTISDRGAAGTASHVGGLRLGSDTKCRSTLGQQATVDGEAAAAELPVPGCAPCRSD
jgi:hypothetical protein